MAQATTKAPPVPGKFCWNELMTEDVQGAEKFYTSLFGWKTEKMEMGPVTYTVLKAGDKEAAGLMALPEEAKKHGAQPTWMAYVTVTDVDASTKKAESLGAKVCAAPQDIPNMGRFSVITDPTGATLGLFPSAK